MVYSIVVEKDQRPTLPMSPYLTEDISRIVQKCWVKDPNERPTFKHLVEQTSALLVTMGRSAKQSPRPKMLDEIEAEEKNNTRVSPDIKPSDNNESDVPRMCSTLSTCDVLIPLIVASPLTKENGPSSRSSINSSSDHSFHTPADTIPVQSMLSSIRPCKLDIECALEIAELDKKGGSKSRSTSVSTSVSSYEGDNFSIQEPLPDNVLDEKSPASSRRTGYDSPSPVDHVTAERRNERRYRFYLAESNRTMSSPVSPPHNTTEHPIHLSFTTPLWSPSHVQIGDVGYLSKPYGHYVTLLNVFDPVGSSNGVVHGLPSIFGYGAVGTNTIRWDRRSAAARKLDRGLEIIAGLLTFRSKAELES